VRADGLPGGQLDAGRGETCHMSPMGRRLQPEITRHEPAGALFAGPDGLDANPRPRRRRARRPWIALEHGAEQGAAVRALLGGRARVQTHRDLAGHERATAGHLTEATRGTGPAR